MTCVKLPLAKDLEDFNFAAADVNETLVRDLAAGGFIEQQRTVVLIRGTGTGTSHAAIAIARACILWPQARHENSGWILQYALATKPQAQLVCEE